MYEVALALDCTTIATAEVLMAGINRAIRGEMMLAPGSGVRLLPETLTAVPRPRLPVYETIPWTVRRETPDGGVLWARTVRPGVEQGCWTPSRKDVPSPHYVVTHDIP